MVIIDIPRIMLIIDIPRIMLIMLNDVTSNNSFMYHVLVEGK